MKHISLALLILSFMFMKSACLAVVDLSAGLVAYYPFSGNADDAGPNQYHGTINGQLLTTADRFGTPSSAYSFNGTNSYISIPGQPFALQNFTISIHVKPNSSQSAYAGIIDRNHLGDINWVIQRNNTANEFYMYYRANGTNITSDCFTLNYNSWNHLIVVKNGANIKVYRDGILVMNKNTDNPTITYTNLPLIIGAVAGTTRFFSGSLDDVRIYNRALSIEEITALVSQDARSGLVAYYPFNGNTLDESGNDNHGTSNGGVSFTSDRFGVLNSAGKFNGTDGYISVPGKNFTSQDFTISLHINPNLVQTNLVGIIDKGYNPANSGNNSLFKNWIIRKNNPSSTDFSFCFSSPSGIIESSGFTLTANTWTHLVVTKNGASIRIYKNGLLMVDEIESSSTINMNVHSILIGGVGSENNYFNGLLDDIRIYNRYLSADEVSTLNYEENAGPSPELYGSWSAPLNKINNKWPNDPVTNDVSLHLHLLPNGKLLTWAVVLVAQGKVSHTYGTPPQIHINLVQIIPLAIYSAAAIAYYQMEIYSLPLVIQL